MELVLFVLFLASAASHKPAPPLKCGVNEYAVPCKTICPPQNCDIAYTDYACDPKPKCIPGCDCIKDHLRNSEKKCVFNENCPAPSEANNPPQKPQEPTKSTSGTNNGKSSSQSESSASTSSSSSSSNSSSSSQSSSSSYSSYSSNNGTRAPPLKCGVNEYAVPCKTICPPQNCDISYTTYMCDPKPKCIPGCDCIKDHLRNDKKICILNDNCVAPSGK